jgi:hypothetical protein
MADKTKVKENKSWGGLTSPRFTLMLEAYTAEDRQRKSNYEVLSKLIGDNDILMELDSSLLNLPAKQREPYALQFLKDIRTLGVEYKCSKVASTSIPSFISSLFGNKASPSQQIIASIPNDIWLKQEMVDVISLYGARYYVPKEKTEGAKLFADFEQMMDDERLDYFKLIAFNVITFNSIGVFTKCLNLSEMNLLLGL